MALNLSRNTIAALFLAAVIVAGVGIYYTMNQMDQPTAAYKVIMEEGPAVSDSGDAQAGILIEGREIDCGDDLDLNHAEKVPEGLPDGLTDCDDPTCAGRFPCEG